MRLFILFMLLRVSLNAQNWEAIGTWNNSITLLYTDSISNKLIIGGSFRIVNGDTMSGVAQWDGQQLSRMGCGIEWDCSPQDQINNGRRPWGIQRLNDKLFIAGNFAEINGFPSYGISYWSNDEWTAIEDGLLDANGSKGVGMGLSRINDELIVLGSYDFCSGIAANAACSYSELGGFESLGFPNYEEAQTLKCAAQFQGVNYFGGRFNNATTPTNGDIWNIVKHENGHWLPVGDGIRGGMAGVEKMVVFQDKLYVAGVMSKAAGAPGNAIAAWDGQQWDDVGGGLWAPVEAHVYDMKIYGDKLYVSGIFDFAGGIPVSGIASWDGNNWCMIDNNLTDYIQYAFTFEHYEDTLYVGGVYQDSVSGQYESLLIRQITPAINIQCGNLTGISSVTENKFNVYPNPSTGLINLSFGTSVKGSITVSNVMGQWLVTQSVMGENSTLDLSSFSSGIYFLQFTDQSGSVFTKKILLE